jgi:trigger factor
MGSLEEVEWDPFRMTVLVPIPPEVDLGDYRAVRVPFEVEPVTEEQIAEELAHLQQQYAQWVPVERAAALDDQVVLDMEGKAGDKVILSNEGYEMLLQAEATYPLPGFHEEIVGMSPGEKKTFLLAVPEDDEDQDAAGQEATVTVHLHSVKAEDLPSLADELAMMVGDYETLDALKTSIQERLETEARQKTESEYLDRILEAMVEAAVKIEYPSQAIDREAEFALNQMERNLASSGIQLDTYLRMLGKSREAYQQELRPAAEERLKKRLVMRQVAEREGLTVKDEEIEAEIDRLSEMMGEQAGQMREVLESPGGRLTVADDLMVDRTQKRIIAIAKGEAPPLEEVTEAEEEAPPEAEAEVQQAAGPATESEAEGGPEGESDQEPAEPAPESDAPAEEPEAGAEPESGASN